MRETLSKEGIVEYWYDSLSEWEQDTKIRVHPTSPMASWNGGYFSYEEAYKDASSSNKYSEKINKLTGKLTKMIQASIPDYQPQFDVTGLGFDVGLALSGVPECWVSMTPSKDPKVVKILCNCAISAGTEESKIIKKGIAICALIQCLEMSGISTEITLAVDSKPYSDKFPNGIRIFVLYKQAGEYFDLEKFAWGICSPGFYRSLGIAAILTKTRCSLHDSLPWPKPRITGEGWDMFFPHMYLYDTEFATEESTIDWVVGKCREYGVEITSPLLK